MTKDKKTLSEEVKELLSDQKNIIKLDDFVSSYIKDFLDKTSLENFPVQGSNVQKEDVIERIESYEKITKDLQEIVILLARWGNSEAQLILEKIFDRLIEAKTGTSGLTIWLRMRWYPIILLLYSAGISALSAKRYDLFVNLLRHKVVGNLTDNKKLPLVVSSFVFSGEIGNNFKLFPGMERRYTAFSERILSVTRPIINDILFIGDSYERLFDEFEVYSYIICADLTPHNWGPIGRFGWKYDRDEESSPFHQVIKYAKESGDNFELLKFGCFNGSLDKFLEVIEVLQERLNKLGWF